ncbi:hypothetical protein QQF64_019803 [Cirrhinus molitorella]|uniref:Uncharacterized protein n=1 Tax=Cirrhinus molitorella TaxID=172907 RepID=A0ABR3LGI6_9TELE
MKEQSREKGIDACREDESEKTTTSAAKERGQNVKDPKVFRKEDSSGMCVRRDVKKHSSTFSLDDSFPQKNSPVANHSELHRSSKELKPFRDASAQTNSSLSETQLGIQMLLA